MEAKSWATTAGTRRSMRSNRGRDTKPEIAVRRLVHAQGLRYRVSARPEPDLRRTADLLFTRARVAVFIDGCYWHGCPVHYTAPVANGRFWAEKVARNRERDGETTAVLKSRDWTVLHFWEHESAHLVADEIVATVRNRRTVELGSARRATKAGEVTRTDQS
ncbi:very short patch repair endonuclease [Plantibacter elymi (nom. nud.)]|nr:very short patch repair endonuclease [Plantibacter sp. VKM Ac-1784]